MTLGSCTSIIGLNELYKLIKAIVCQSFFQRNGQKGRTREEPTQAPALWEAGRGEGLTALADTCGGRNITTQVIPKALQALRPQPRQQSRQQAFAAPATPTANRAPSPGSATAAAPAAARGTRHSPEPKPAGPQGGHHCAAPLLPAYVVCQSGHRNSGQTFSQL